MDPRFITPVLITVLVIWGLYRRARRFIGRQTLQPGRLWTRIVIFAVVGGLFVIVSARDKNTLMALLAGLCCGAALGWLGLKYTKFETTPDGRFYTPHAYIGLIVTALLVARVIYRFAILYSGQGFAPAAFGPAGPAGFPAAGYQNPYGNLNTPLTLAIFGALVGYYIAYYLGVLTRSRSPAIAQQPSGAE